MSGTQAGRLAAGGLIDRSRSLGFRFDGQAFTGHPGDTLASALVANGVRLVGRSFKYHRPRGILSAGVEEPNALVELREGARREPNTRATMVELWDGLAATSQNRWPSLGFDLLAVNALAAPVFAAGFYYKTFMWPAAFWERVYEPLIRRAAGLGRAAGAPDPDSYEKMTAFCDVLVIGAGPAGLMAALAAGRTGARVALCEQDFRLGGRALSERQTIGTQSGAEWAAAVAAELAQMPQVQILPRTTVFGVYDGGTYAAVERVSDHLPEPPPYQPRQRLWRIVAKRAVLAAGAIERPLVFGDNDRPGVMLAGAVRSYLNRFAARPGQRAVVFANNDEAARTVADLAAAGIAVAAVVDPRADPPPAVRQAAQAAGARLVADAVVVRAIGGRGLRGADILPRGGSVLRLSCDLLAMSGGWTPTAHLTSHLGGKPSWSAVAGGFVAGNPPPGMQIAGAAAGTFALAGCLTSGAQAGFAAAADCGFAGTLPDVPATEPDTTEFAPLWRVPGHRGKAFVDFQNDVSDTDLELANREGFGAPEHAKRYTTLGMATDQGKTASVNALGILAEVRGRPLATLGTTTFRPPYTPVAIGALAGLSRGHAFRPTRLTPSHTWAEEQGAVFVEAGAWLRAQYFPRSGEAGWLATVSREVQAVRSGVGVCDVSTLGKIDLQGPDAAAFLERLYINRWHSLKIGRARYGVMLREDGFVFDDGTTARLAERHFVMTTTTANAAAVLRHMEFCHQCLWPELDVQFASITDQWAQFSIAGPRAREVVAAIVDPPHDVSNAGFPHLAATELTAFRGVRARLFRISFSGELAYEIAVPARFGDAAIRGIMAEGAPFGIVPYGVEALGVMRIEKGHPAGGELNGQTTARDLGLGRMTAIDKDFIGRAMARRPALEDPERPALVGFAPLEPADRLHAGAHFLAHDAAGTTADDAGHMTSVAFSPTFGHWIGLGLLARGRERIGEVVRATDPVRSAEILVRVCDPAFLDPQGERMRG
ncbi:MAG TPA: sarcosine oxidase subunit alpha family protein [Acetobacteraceae bacterium]|nr:sarcosine oxidase subunit alpha family protein [Acetobacteraceae bacterium]